MYWQCNGRNVPFVNTWDFFSAWVCAFECLNDFSWAVYVHIMLFMDVNKFFLTVLFFPHVKTGLVLRPMKYLLLHCLETFCWVVGVLVGLQLLACSLDKERQDIVVPLVHWLYEKNILPFITETIQTKGVDVCVHVFELLFLVLVPVCEV